MKRSLAAFVTFCCAAGLIAAAYAQTASELRPRRTGQQSLLQPRDVVIGDLVVNIIEFPLSRVTIEAARDDRFVYPRALLKVSLAFSEGSVRPASYEYEDIVQRTRPDPSLYTVPSPMTAYPFTRANQVLVRMPGTTFLGRAAFVVCTVKPVSALGDHNCNIEGQVTDRTRVQVNFTDDLYPPGDWPALLKSIEDGIGKISHPR